MLSFTNSPAQNIDSLQQAYQNADNEVQCSIVLQNIISYYQKSYPDTVATLWTTALKLAEKQRDSAMMYKAYNQLGVAYSSGGDLSAALTNFLKALSIAESLNDLRKRSAVYNNLAYIYFVQKSYEKAIESLEQSLLIDRQRNDRKAEGISLNNLGIMQRALGRFDQAEKNFNKALDIGYETRNDTAVANTLGNLGDLYHIKGEYHKSLEKINIALETSTRANLDYITCIFTLSQARTHQALGRTKDALDAVEAGLALARKNNFTIHLQQGYSLLKSFYESQQNYKLAMEAYKNEMAYQDTILRQDKNDQMAALQVKYETKLKSLKIEQLQKENALANNRLYWMIASAILLCIGLVLTYIMLSLRNTLLRKRNEELVRRHEAEQRITALENEKLQLSLEFKNRQVVSNAVLIAQKNEVLFELKDMVKKISSATRDNEINKDLKTVIREINTNIELSDDWQHIKLHFEEVHPQFFEKLLQLHPDLTVHEQKLCVYIRMKMTNKEIGRLLNITPESVKVLKYRLKKKISLPEDESIQQVLLQV
ncbi:MAG TPA: tetratricopeptide repeat protein [Chryseosolibacter sp.]|nr:tetratricopeptide repeat protein [Chryseosolibacter sp.]